MLLEYRSILFPLTLIKIIGLIHLVRVYEQSMYKSIIIAYDTETSDA